jgi:hypothetical protein
MSVQIGRTDSLSSATKKVFEVPVGQEEAFLAGWKQGEAIKAIIEWQLGYLSTALPRSLDLAAQFRSIIEFSSVSNPDYGLCDAKTVVFAEHGRPKPVRYEQTRHGMTAPGLFCRSD